MAKDKIEGLITTLHDRLGAADTSPEQERMLNQLRAQLVEWQGEIPPERDLVDTAETLLEDIEEHHPRAALVLKDIIQTLRNAGL